jgi:hypothetical protein
MGASDHVLAAAQAAFVRGDFLLTRALVERELKSNPPSATRTQLEALVARTQPDQRARLVLLIAAVTVLLITALTYLQGRATVH